MAITLTKVDALPIIQPGRIRHGILKGTFNNSYASGGDPLTKAMIDAVIGGSSSIIHIIPDPYTSGNKSIRYDRATSKIIATNAAGAGTMYPWLVKGTCAVDGDGAATNGGGLVGLVTQTEAAAAFAVVDDGGVQALLSLSGAAAGYTANYQLFPDAPAAGDAVYFGAAVPFCELAFDMSGTVCTYDAAAVLGWVYWDGSAWSALTLVQDNSSGSTKNGTLSFGRDGAIHFIPPDDWASTTVNGQAGYWIACVIQAGKAANMTAVGITNSVEHKVVTPKQTFTFPDGRTITAIQLTDQASTLHTAADIKFVLVNFTTGKASEVFTFAQDVRYQRFVLTTPFAIAAGDAIGILITQEDGTNEMIDPLLTLEFTTSLSEVGATDLNTETFYLYYLLRW